MKTLLSNFSFRKISAVLLLSLFQLTAFTQDMKIKKGDSKMKMAMADFKTWPMAAQMAIKEQMGLYGKPDEVTPTMVVWNNNGIWKKTIISKMENKHDFPKSHMDCMEQILSYRVPVNKSEMLNEFDGSVNFDRTQGFLSARCDKEENNLLALNLSYDIITGKKTVAEARRSYGEMVMQAMAGNKPEYMKKLMFSSNMNAPDPDVSTIK